MNAQKADAHKAINPEEEWIELKPIIRPKDVIEKVETFIQHLRNLDYVVDKSIREVTFEGRYLFDILAVSMSNYEVNKDEPATKWTYAKVCLKWINTAFAVGAIKEGQGLVSKLEEITKRNIEFENDLRRISEELFDAKDKIEELKQQIPNYGSEHA